jgi:hypothetical protein
MAVTDISITSFEGDLIISEGDFIINRSSDQQHIHDILSDAPGEWKRTPLLGLNLKAYQYGPANTTILQRNMKIMLTSDGYQSNPIVEYSYQRGKLLIDPKAVRIK